MEILLIKHFWLIAAIWAGVGNALSFRFSLAKAAKEGKIEIKEVNKIAWRIAFCIAIPCLALWLIEIKYGNVNPIFFQQNGVASTLSTIIIVTCWIALFCWVWIFNGANSLAKIYPLAGYKLGIYAKPITYKILVVLLLVVGISSITVQKSIFGDLQTNSNKAVERNAEVAPLPQHPSH